MPTPQLGSINPDATLTELKDYLVGINRYLNYLLSSLDTLNISRLDAKVIIAQSITAGKLSADSVETANLQAGAVTADKITVAYLSAIAADLGTITAGIINAVTINGATINISEDVTIGNNLYVGNNDLTSGSKIYLNGAYIQSALGPDSLTLGSSGVLTVTSLTDVVLSSSGNVGVVSSFGTVADIVGSINSLTSSISSLTSAIAGKVSSGSSTSSTSVSDSHNHGIANGTQLLDADGVTTHTWVAYAGSASHSHTV